jgi:hypothetical protein
MNIDKSKIYTDMNDFFLLGGSVAMRLSPDAAVAVCRNAAVNGLVVARVEGGIWHFPGFESRLDCIWDGIDPPADYDHAEKNNQQAAAFIERQKEVHNVFILTAPPIQGWPHKNKS